MVPKPIPGSEFKEAVNKLVSDPNKLEALLQRMDQLAFDMCRLCSDLEDAHHVHMPIHFAWVIKDLDNDAGDMRGFLAELNHP
jgi:hypothetical protein